MSLTFTGERFHPECQGEMVYEHWHRYLFAARLAANQRVLDVASGEGYGAALLAEVAREVTGVDLSAEAVAHARARYRRSNLSFIEAPCTRIPRPDASFDLVVSFETIEHITEQESFLAEIARLLAPGGRLVISSPNRPEYSEKTGYRNEFHARELDRAELAALLTPQFPAQRWFAQRAAFHSLLWPLERPATAVQALAVDGGSAWPEPMYFVVVAAREEAALTALDAMVTLVTDREQSVYAEWSRTYRENAAAREEIARLRAELERLSGAALGSALPPTAPHPAEPWLVRLARRLCQRAHPGASR
ncbi:MAG: class I SAM-dependent methyltransferase [Casimicrobiaceae bacterium]|nr:class I SAM-dependent methyltransferase [Casimicrobiaceae bacterium]MCX8098092.1 class I SAM-dependent methyltransferase [Casimicrobiaceae bacterium]MDW8311630.1 class I SAM-dependent methyltransferase [Burkholderiales bacterium]